jgi:hypothetical protein
VGSKYQMVAGNRPGCLLHFLFPQARDGQCGSEGARPFSTSAGLPCARYGVCWCLVSAREHIYGLPLKRSGHPIPSHGSQHQQQPSPRQGRARCLLPRESPLWCAFPPPAPSALLFAATIWVLFYHRQSERLNKRLFVTSSLMMLFGTLVSTRSSPPPHGLPSHTPPAPHRLGLRNW